MRIRIGYFLAEALVSFRRNWVMSLAAVSTVAISLIVLGGFIILALNLNTLIRNVESKVEITVYLKDGASSIEIQDLQDEVISWAQVANVTYVSKEEALNRLRRDLRDQPEMLEAISGNPLPASLEVKLQNPRTADSVANRLNGRPIIDEIKYGRDLAKKLFTVTMVIRWIGIIFILLLFFASLVLIANTIRLAIFARRKEIGLMKLVGATNWFIRWPFMLEGILQGVVGSVLAVVVLYLANVFFLMKAEELIPFLPLSFSQVLLAKLMVALALAGASIGAIGSMIALRKFLKV